MLYPLSYRRAMGYEVSIAQVMGLSTDADSLSARILAQAHRLGFDLAGIAPGDPPATVAHYRAWLERGYHGDMAYLALPDAVSKRHDLGRLVPGIRSVVAVAVNHDPGALSAEPGQALDERRGAVAAYALGADYHAELTARLEELAAYLAAEGAHGAAVSRAYVDTGPVLERDLAVAAGLGFIGKNTQLIHPQLGSWLFLGELLTTVSLAPLAGRRSVADPQPAPRRIGCGRCTRCLDACPTGALVAPYLLDARRCVSYLTIESKGPIPADLRPGLGNHIFGCDVCQEVCPWNRRFARPGGLPSLQPRADCLRPDLLSLMVLDEAAFALRFGDSPIRRANRRGLLRNVAVALGNTRNPAAVPALGTALSDAEPLIRGHAAWALGQIDSDAAHDLLRQALVPEADNWVQAEIRQALG